MSKSTSSVEQKGMCSLHVVIYAYTWLNKSEQVFSRLFALLYAAIGKMERGSEGDDRRDVTRFYYFKLLQLVVAC